MNKREPYSRESKIKIIMIFKRQSLNALIQVGPNYLFLVHLVAEWIIRWQTFQTQTSSATNFHN